MLVTINSATTCSMVCCVDTHIFSDSPPCPFLSIQEPAQVFILLEKVYKSFDDIAKRRGVFKVETVSSPDCSLLYELTSKQAHIGL
jgi:hypothetical protein